MKPVYLLPDLLPGEHIIREGSGYVLTTVRLRSVDNKYIKSLMLSEVTSCKMEYVENLWWVVMAAVTVALGFVVAGVDRSVWPLIVAGLLAVIMLYAYRDTRSGKVVIASPTLQISIYFQGADRSEMLTLVDALEQAKHLPSE